MKKKLTYLVLWLCMIPFCNTYTQIVVPAGGSAVEDFDTSNPWTFGGTNHSWVYGNPNKTEIIDDISGGGNCIILGGNGVNTHVNDYEDSWAESPEYDLSAVDNPYIEFWFYHSNEANTDFDEIWMDYTLDNGISWNVLSPPVGTNTCYDQNWYNFPDNWGGASAAAACCSSSGFCSMGNDMGPTSWMKVRKCVAGTLANAPSVRFRFRSKNGDRCNFYGATVDNFTVADANLQADFSAVNAAALSVNFTDLSERCPDAWAWDFGDGNTSSQQNPTHTYTAGGNYTVRLIATASSSATTSCGGTLMDTISYSINVLEIETVRIQQPSCHGVSDGAISVNVLGLTGSGETYTWSPSPATGAGTSSISNLDPGVYNLTVTPAGGGNIATYSATITDPDPLSVTANVSDESCGSGNGEIDITVTGGNVPYRYAWSTGASNEDVTNLNADSYTVTVTDNNDCIITDTISVGSVVGATVTLDSIIHPTCNGGNNGAINIDVTTATSSCSSSSVVINEIFANVPGGLPQGDGSGCGNSGNPLSAEFIELMGPPNLDISCYVLTDGDWTITIPSGVTIPSDGIFTIGNNNTPLHSSSNTTFDLDANNCNCFTGSCQLMIFTNSGEYLAVYDDSGQFIDGLIYGNPNTNNTPTAGDVISTSALTGCVSNVTIPSISSFTTISPASAEGFSYVRVPDGAGNSFTTRAASPNRCNNEAADTIRYLWSTGDTTQNISGLTAGSYTVTVSSNGCSTIESYTLVDPSLITVTSNSIVDATCTVLGSIDITATGGTGAYSYNWTNGETSEDITNLTAADYTVTVTDANNCSVVEGPFTVGRSNTPVITVDTIIDVRCAGGNNGSIELSITNGTPAYSYNWSNNTSMADLTAVSSGTYGVTVTDANDCTVTGSYTIAEPSAISLSTVVTNATCVDNDGVIDLTVMGGTGAYTYEWSNNQTTQNIDNLTNTSYQVTVTDANACTATNTTTVGLDTTIRLNFNTTGLDCSGNNTAAISTVVLDAAPNYTYSWSTGSTSANLTALDTGTYTVTVTDASGCTISGTTSIAPIVRPSIAAFINSTGITSDSITIGESVTLDAGNDETNLGVNYSWTSSPAGVNFSTGDQPSTVVTPESIGSYIFTLTATSPDACRESTDLILKVKDVSDPAIPTAFSPNNDGLNKEFKVVNLQKQYLQEFKVFNRWGVLVYDDATNGSWDGTYKGNDQPVDTYIYVISYQRPEDQEPVVLRGTLTLLR